MFLSVSLEHVRRVTQLARIGTDEVELERLSQQLDGILGWISQLQAIPVSQEVVLMTQIAPERADCVAVSNRVSDILKNAPAERFSLFEVPKMVD